MDIPAPTPTSVQEVAGSHGSYYPAEEEDPAPEMKIEVKAVPEEETVDTLSKRIGRRSMGPLTLRSNSVGLNSLRSTCSKLQQFYDHH